MTTVPIVAGFVALAALAWANIDEHSYHDVWGQELKLGFGELAGIFDVVPHPINDFPQFPFDFLGIVNRI